MDKDQIDISVILLTYNQEDYITESLDSILSQNFNGSWEVIVADDCSIDDTLKIIESKISAYPGLIKIFSNDSNLGLARNYQKAIDQVEGKYIAYLEGDDYWTDPYKLQKQYEFLESNPEFVLAFHDFVTIDKNGNQISDKNLSKPTLRRNRSKSDMITGCLIHQNTIMYRNVFSKFPMGFFMAKNYDTFLIAYLSKWGEAGYVNCFPLHYRIVENSLWSSLSKSEKNRNGLITYFWIFTIAPLSSYYVLSKRIFSKIKSLFYF